MFTRSWWSQSLEICLLVVDTAPLAAHLAHQLLPRRLPVEWFLSPLAEGTVGLTKHEDDDFFSLSEVDFHFQHKFYFLFVFAGRDHLLAGRVCVNCFCELHCQHTA